MSTANHVMIDLEALGLKPGCVIVSIGAVIFDPRYNVITDKTLYSELDIDEQTEQGFTKELSTVEWWINQSPKAKEALLGIDDLEETLKELSAWLPKDCKVWGNGPTFDISILEHAYDLFDIEIPWEFWNVRDCRTIKDLYESARGGYSKKCGGVKHNALDDALFQAQYVNDMWKSILSGE